MTYLILGVSLFLQIALPVASQIATGPSGTARPQLQIVYNDKLREAMKRFDITEADMDEMLTNYMENGKSPTITKSILNPDTNLQETITLDFQGFAQEWAEPKQPTTTAANKLMTRVVSSDSKTAGIRSAKVGTNDRQSLEDQKNHLMRGMMILDAESTDLTVEFESGRMTQHVYQQRMLENRQLYRALMTQLIKVQSLLEEYKLTTRNAPVSARRDSSRVATADPTDTLVMSPAKSSASQLQSLEQIVYNKQPSQTDKDKDSVHEKRRMLEDLRQQNAILKLRLREEQERVSPASNANTNAGAINDISLKGPSNVNTNERGIDDINDISLKEPLRLSNSVLNSIQSGTAFRQSARSNGNSAINQDPDIVIHPMVPVGGESALKDSVGSMILQDAQPVGLQSRLTIDPSASPLSSSLSNLVGDDAALQSPYRARQQLLMEYRRLQERKRRIYEILRQNRRRVL